MPFFQLTEELVFPPVHLSESDGLLAVGGDLSVERLTLAYTNGIFPWFNEGEPILWWTPDPRLVLFPNKIYVSKSMRRWMNKKMHTVSYNQQFRQVITACKQQPREGQEGTWITPEMIEAYCELHNAGKALSVEVWNANKELVGGMYGVLLDKVFFGESMFSMETNTSKLALISLCETLISEGVELIDCQVHSEHLSSLGAELMTRKEFLTLLNKLICC
ncbi:MAG: leucyl/phenylalanyl-tRNA--protein transferase [Cyclobacteriaceae bacterium]